MALGTSPGVTSRFPRSPCEQGWSSSCGVRGPRGPWGHSAEDAADPVRAREQVHAGHCSMSPAELPKRALAPQSTQHSPNPNHPFPGAAKTHPHPGGSSASPSTPQQPLALQLPLHCQALLNPPGSDLQLRALACECPRHRHRRARRPRRLLHSLQGHSWPGHGLC